MMKLVTVMAAMAVILAGGAAGETRSENVPAFSFTGGLPDGWNAYVADNGQSDIKVTEEGEGGAKVMVIDANAEYAGASTPHEVLDKSRRYEASAAIKVQGEPGSSASVKIDYYDASDAWIGDSVAAVPAGTEGWHLVGIADEAAKHEGARMIAISVSVLGKAKAWFAEPKFFSRGEEAGNLLPNGHVEQVGVNGVPTGWGLSHVEGATASMKAVAEAGAEGRFALHLSAREAEWVSAAAVMAPIELGEKAIFHLRGRVKATSGTAQLLLAYFENGNFIGASTSPGAGGEWQNLEVFSELETYPNATHIVPAAFGSGNVEAWFDSMVMTAK